MPKKIIYGNTGDFLPIENISISDIIDRLVVLKEKYPDAILSTYSSGITLIAIKSPREETIDEESLRLEHEKYFEENKEKLMMAFHNLKLDKS